MIVTEEIQKIVLDIVKDILISVSPQTNIVYYVDETRDYNGFALRLLIVKETRNKDPYYYDNFQYTLQCDNWRFCFTVGDDAGIISKFSLHSQIDYDKIREDLALVKLCIGSEIG